MDISTQGIGIIDRRCLLQIPAQVGPELTKYDFFTGGGWRFFLISSRFNLAHPGGIPVRRNGG
jgi:hypothetical protein